MRPFLLAVLVGILAVPVAAQDLTAAFDAARQHVADRAVALGATPADARDLVVTDAHASATSGLTYVYLRQQIGGVEVAGSEITVAVRRDGTVGHAAGRLVPALNRAVAPTPGLSAEAAVLTAAAHVGADLAALPSVDAVASDASRRTAFVTPAEALAPLTARLLYHSVDGSTPVLTWEVGPLEVAGVQPHAWMVRVDATTGAEVWRGDLVDSDPMPETLGEAAPAVAPVAGPLAVSPAVSAQVGQYRVYPIPQEGPNEGDAVLVADPSDALASPFGWHDTDGVAGAEFTITRGNNVHAYLDTDANNAPDPRSEPDGGAALVFDFPADLTLPPSAYQPASVTNLFFWSNVIHDILYRYGFDEASGNFQVNNYGRGGMGGDDLRAEGQDGAGTNNANFSTPADGARPRMQMYIYTLTNPHRDGDFSNMTLVHEYAHGLTNRLTGGASATGCLSNAEQMGEGWGDWLAAMFTMEPTDTRVTNRPYGPYPRGLDPNGPGLRNAPLNTDFTRNNYTYQRTRSGLSVPHGVGFVWSTILWEVAWEMIDAYGFDPDLYNAAGTAGNQMMIQLMVEGLKLQPCSPGFVDGRDAILAADALLYPDPAEPGRGLHYAALWTGFARRGLGVSASQGSSSSNADNTEAFDVPLPAAQALIDTTPIAVDDTQGTTPTVSVALQNVAPAGSQDLTYTASIENLTFVPELTATPPAAQGGTGVVYAWDDSDMPGGPVLAWVDISGTGTAVTLNDDNAASVTLPFAFPFYGVDQTRVIIGSNGFLTFGTSGTGSNNNQNLPNPAVPNDLIAMYWDDLNPALGGTVHTQDMGDGRFIVQFTDVPHVDVASETVTFQAILSANGQIVLQYLTLNDDASDPNSHTVGIENADGSEGLTVAFNAPYLTANKAVRFRLGRTWVTLPAPTGTLAPGATGTLELAFDADGLPVDVYTADLVIATSDPTLASVTIPVTFNVTGTVSTASEAPTVLTLDAPRPNPARGATTVGYNLPAAGPARLSVVDLLGREVAVLADGDGAAGRHTATVSTARLAAGVYVVRLVAAQQTLTQRLVVTR